MEEDKVREILDGFGTDYKPPSTTEDEWGNWADSIEIKLSKQGQIIVGLTIGLGVTLLLTSLQGKVVINLVKGHKMVIDAINTISGNLNDNVHGESDRRNYAQPEKVIDESKIGPVDEQQVEELRQRMVESQQTIEFGDDL